MSSYNGINFYRIKQIQYNPFSGHVLISWNDGLLNDGSHTGPFYETVTYTVCHSLFKGWHVMFSHYFLRWSDIKRGIISREKGFVLSISGCFLHPNNEMHANALIAN